MGLFICIIYAVLVTAFLAVQFWGFLVGHTHYSDGIEEPKFEMLKAEESEWQS